MSKANDEARSDLHFETRAARAGKDARPARGRPTATPIVPSSAFEHDSSAAVDEIFEGAPGYVYGRFHNPTVDALEDAIADLEGAEAALAYGSGMAAIAGALEALPLPRGAKVVASRDLYGATVNWFEGEAERRGWQLELVDVRPEAFDHGVLEGAAVMFCETISNPLVRVADVDDLAAACAAAGVTLIVDATFTPPPLLYCLEHGATLVLHSATKYLGGHGDAVAGVVAGPATLLDVARAHRNTAGTIADPFTAWLMLRGIKTLALRVERQCANAARIVEHLLGHDAVERVHYPGVTPRDTPEEKALLARLLPHGRYGAMLAFEIAGGGDAEVRRFVDTLRLWGNATTLGDLDSLVLIPAMTSHRGLGEQRRAEYGITPGLVRLSVGIESADDLIADLDRAFAALR